MCKDNTDDAEAVLSVSRELIPELLALPAEALRVYIYLTSLDRGQGFAASIPMIGHATGRADRSVKTDLKTLREKKLIIRQPGRGNQPNRYSLPQAGGKAGQTVDPLEVLGSQSEQVARERVPPGPPVVKHTSVCAEGRHIRRNTFPSGGDQTEVKAECVAPRPTTPDLRTTIRELIAACYRPITDQEYADLKKTYPDEALLASMLQGAKQRYFGVEAERSLCFFTYALDSVS